VTSDDFSEEEPPAPPTALPETLWTIRYEYGTPFSYGPIGKEVIWLFADQTIAEESIEEAQEIEPESGALHVSEATLAEVGERFPLALYVDENGQPWPLVISALESLAPPDDTPLPDEPFALFTDGGGIDRYYEEAREGDWVVHRDEDEGVDYVLFFEDLDTAEQVLKDFIEATGEHAEVRRTWAQTLTEDQGVRYHHANGHVEDIPRNEYLRRCR